jgi:glycosyltransferase involved in cell wall biosynthesis
MRVLLWHVHGSWTTAFVQGEHTVLLPCSPDRGPDGRGRARTWQWPERAVEVPMESLRDCEVDVVVLQRPHELDLARRLLGRRPGVDVPAVYLEHNTPRGDAPTTPHPMARQEAVPVVHVTHFNALMWDTGAAPTRVIEHGVPDPGYQYDGRLPRVAVAVNEPIRRSRVAGVDLLPGFAAAAPLDVFGMGVRGLAARLGLPPERCVEHDDPPQHVLHAHLARRRVYAHPYRWTSLGLALLEAMLLGMPVVALATTEAPHAVPPEAGVCSNRPEVLHAAVRRFLADPAEAAERGRAARRAALRRYGLARFLADWDALLREMAPGSGWAEDNDVTPVQIGSTGPGETA